MSAKILTLDIETSPLEVYAWGLWDQNIGLDFIKTEWSILSWAAKWLGKNKVMYKDTGGRGADKVRDDRALLDDIAALVDEADIVIAQNGRRFDMKKINARLILNGMLPPSPVRLIDTMEVAKRYFAFTSQKLKWTSKYLAGAKKEDHKEYPGFELWTACLADDPKAWRVMKRYNCQDIRATEEVYLRMRPWIENHPNMGLYLDSERPCCPRCGSLKMHIGSTPRTSVKTAASYQRYRCSDCGGWARGKAMQTPLDKRRRLLVAE